jgi:hypothetical protein
MKLTPTDTLCLLLAGLASAGVAWAQEVASDDQLTVINYARTPVYATAVSVPAETVYQALGLPVGTPLEAVAEDGAVMPLLVGQDAGRDVVRAYVSLRPGERRELTLRKSERWAAVDAVSRADFDVSAGRASLANGVVRFEYQGDNWALSLDGPQADAVVGPEDRRLLKGCRIDLWLDAERRGRLLGMSPEKVKATGLIHSQDAKLTGGEAKVNPDGSAILRLTRRFEGFAQDVKWTETYTLLPGRPVLIFRLTLATEDDAKRYLAFVQHGGGVHGRFGNLLMGKQRFGYQDPREPKRLLLAGSENGALRIGWRGEKCWFAADSELGNGIGIATTREIKRGIPGSRIWTLSPRGFFSSFIDTEQENMPYEFSAGKPLELGFAFIGTQGGVSVWHQTQQLFRNVTKGTAPPISSSCAVYLGGILLRTGEVDSFADEPGTESKMMRTGSTAGAAFTVAFQRPYQLAARAEGVAGTNPIAIKVCPVGQTGTALDVMSLDQPGEQQIDFTGLTKWEGKRRSFTLDVIQPAGTRLTNLRLEPAGFPAPEPGTPIDGMSLTDLAVFFRWRQVKGALDYEIQLSRDEAFNAPKTLTVRSEADWPYYLPQDDELPAPGTWFWRVRAIEPERPGEWSVPRSFTVNNDHAKRPVGFVISPERPLFTIEACRVRDLSHFTNTIPADIKPYVAFNCSTKFNHIDYLKPLHEAGITAFVRTHGPGVMSYWMPLADVEAVFQAYTNVIGIMGGETLSTHYHGGPNQTYVNRLLKLCGKYGRIYYDADGTYPSENKWEALYAKEDDLMREYADHLVFAQKNNILHRQFVSQSSVLGLYLSDAILAQGAWEDGGWYWQQTGFRELGEILGQRGGTTGMPRNFWNLNFLMGIARGCTVFSFEGQTGTIPVSVGWKLAEQGVPPQFNPTAHWTTEGELTETFHRFCLPFIRAVIEHQLVPTKEDLLQNTRLAVYNDGVPKMEDGDQYYYEWEALYRETYGFRDVGVIPGTLMEFFPNTGRYNYFPVFPQGKVELNGIETLPLSRLMDAARVKARFDAAYPEWYQGDALVTLAGDTLIVLNTHENQDVTESFSVPLERRGAFTRISGKIEPHAYLVGKFEDGNRRLWLQVNAEYAERDTVLTLTCAGRPQVKITPESAARINTWSAGTGTLTLRLSHADGAVEVDVAR